ncbi:MULTISPECIES: glycoside hydrolase family protein [Francisella]|uniref:hypothetical protein n=1 Tax=Francisella TaxID=262 RepID=UPI00168D53D5|nr:MULTISPECIES: hypothetical protein [Francisella]MBK2297075.1 hypothetical protein [Francisella philomiragia]MBK2341321.1 hypothetical protein [Francisella philomiragia]
MKWEKKGLIYTPPKDNSWRDNSALTPTAYLLNDEVIRIYVSFRDTKGVGRIGFVDVEAKNPSKIIQISNKPVLDVGQRGMFDDNGMILGDLINVDNKIYMYYVGFQKVENVKFLAYSGLAISHDNGESFIRYQQTPILDRTQEALYIRAIHSVIYEDEKFRVWYATGSGWENINGVDYPQYDINHIESDNGIDFSNQGIKCIENNNQNKEYRIGRPRVYKYKDKYIMNFTYGTTDGRYTTGQAESLDGVSWLRDDYKRGIDLSEDGWDSVHLSYPSVIKTNYGTYMFYNGNNMGLDGFGYAKLVEN